jgi:hypothetical protein
MAPCPLRVRAYRPCPQSIYCCWRTEVDTCVVCLLLRSLAAAPECWTPRRFCPSRLGDLLACLIFSIPADSLPPLPKSQLMSSLALPFSMCSLLPPLWS